MVSHRLVRGIGASRDARGQASLLMLAAIGAVLVGAAILFAFGNALGARGKHQRAADLAAISAAQAMRDLYPRLFEPPFIAPDVPNPRHLEESEYRARAIAAAIRGACRNGMEIGGADVTFPGSGFAPTRVTVRVLGGVRVRLASQPPSAPARKVAVTARATAELLPTAGGGLPAHASGGGYDGPLAYRQGKPTPRLFSAL
jgi:hypothetical protein